MIKKYFILLATLLSILLAGCGASTAITTPPKSVAIAPTVVTFADPVLEAMVRAAIGKPEGKITVVEAKAVTRLNLSNEW